MPLPFFLLLLQYDFRQCNRLQNGDITCFVAYFPDVPVHKSKQLDQLLRALGMLDLANK